MVDSISLLPEELRKRETEAKSQAKKVKTLPSFSMHLPEKLEEKMKNGRGRQKGLPAQAGAEISFGAPEEEKEKDRGIFKISKTAVFRPEAPKVKAQPNEPLPKLHVPAQETSAKAKTLESKDFVLQAFEIKFWRRIRILVMLLALLVVVLAMFLTSFWGK